MPLDSAVAKLTISADECGRGPITLNGMDIGHCVTGISFKAEGHGLSEIKLTIMAEVDATITAKLENIALSKQQTEQKTVRLADGRVVPVRHRTA